MSGKKSLAKRILSVLEKDPRHEYNAPTIDRILCGERNYIKAKREHEVHKIRTELRRMVKRGLIRCDQKGFYSLIITHRNLHVLGDVPVMCHGLKIEARMIRFDKHQKTIDGITSPCNKIDDDLAEWMKARCFVETTNARFYKRINWEGRWVTVTLHPLNGMIEIWLKASLNPLDAMDLIRFREFLKGMFNEITDMGGAIVSQIGINKDFKELRMEGVSCISLKNFTNCIWRIYQTRELGMRFEAHWSGKIDLNAVVMLIAQANAKPEPKKEKSKWDEGGMFG
jgi:hypothetical protein